MRKTKKKTVKKVANTKEAVFAVLTMEADGTISRSQDLHVASSVEGAAEDFNNNTPEDDVRDGDTVYKLVPVAVIRRPTGYTVEKVK